MCENWINFINKQLIKNIQIDNIINNKLVENNNVVEDIFNINIFIEKIEKKNIQLLNSLELLELELEISINLNKYYFSYNNNNKSIIIKLLNKILNICQILKDKLNMKTIQIKKDMINKNNVPRSSYKFCNHKDACKFNYSKDKNKKCHNHHYVHNLLEYDIYTIIYYIENLITENNLNNNQEIIKSFTTINYVIKHMYEELNNIKLYSKKNECIEKYHHYNYKIKNKKFRQPLF